MANVPSEPSIYHITHLRNLPRIVEAGSLWSDAKRIELRLPCTLVGMSEIKRRRLEELEVKCHPGTKVGQYVPFYFCPRSYMLYVLHMGNLPGLEYREGQGPLVHLQADLRATIEWADAREMKWAFSDRNASARLAAFFKRWDELDKINWAAVAANDFRDMLVKEGKQAEFLIFETFPCTLVEKIGVLNQATLRAAKALLADCAHKPLVCVERAWYF